MNKKILKLLFERSDGTHVLRSKSGQVVFVGTFRQLRRRLQIQYGAGRSQDVLDFLVRQGYEISKPVRRLFLSPNSLYNKHMSEPQSQISNLKSKITTIPKEPGVYQFKNKDGEVIYVGKAKNLKSRISQYFTGHDNRPQLPYLVEEATDVDYTVVGNELESLFLESTLIKKYLPKYNIMLRDDKNYAFITIDYRTQIPSIGYARKFENNPQSKISNLKSKIKYFGPYSAAWKIRNTLNLVRRIFPYCANTEIGSRPCFYYYLHRCPGVCIDKISLEEYNLQLDRICWFLSGNTSKITQELKNEMKIASSEQQFEKAGRLRDQLQALELLEERQNVIMPKPVSWDIISIAENSGYACVNLFKVRDGKMLDKENFIYEITTKKSQHTSTSPEGRSAEKYDMAPEGSQTAEDYKKEILQNFLEQYYLEASDVAKAIYTEVPAEDSELIGHIIRSRFEHGAEITMPQKGKPLELIKLGVTNAEEYLKNWLSNQAGHLDKINLALEELKEQLHLEKNPQRVECYDISNIQGTNPVGSMVVFDKGLPKKSEYRKFKIQGKKTPDDFAMMKEMLTRPFARSAGKNQESNTKNQPVPNSGDVATAENLKSETSNQRTQWPLPDLIVIDGGKGQLGAACEVMEKAGVHIPVIGLAKRIEEIFFPNDSTPLVLPHGNPGLQLLQRLRDETHRFGITFHRQLRSKQAVKSALDDIPGIGPKTKKLLKQKFGTVAQIRKTSLDDLAKAVGEHLARLIQQSL